jgi:hypothetical protein
VNWLEERVQRVFNEQGYFIARSFDEIRLGTVVNGIKAGEDKTSQVVVVGTATREEFFAQCHKYHFAGEPGTYYYRVLAE